MNQLKELIERHKDLNEQLLRQSREEQSADQFKATSNEELDRVTSSTNLFSKDIESLKTSVALTNEKIVIDKKTPFFQRKFN